MQRSCYLTPIKPSRKVTLEMYPFWSNCPSSGVSLPLHALLGPTLLHLKTPFNILVGFVFLELSIGWSQVDIWVHDWGWSAHSAPSLLAKTRPSLSDHLCKKNINMRKPSLRFGTHQNWLVVVTGGDLPFWTTWYSRKAVLTLLNQMEMFECWKCFQACCSMLSFLYSHWLPWGEIMFLARSVGHTWRQVRCRRKAIGQDEKLILSSVIQMSPSLRAPLQA